MPDDINDILFVFLVNDLSSIVQRRAVTLPSGVDDFVRVSVIESNGTLPFPSDLADILFTYGISLDDRI
ncbi:MAG: hypothetical protein J6B02_05245 [Selenomonadales bacterium]|nr:hypothetical protein [Selenomonadales bacterium]